MKNIQKKYNEIWQEYCDVFAKKYDMQFEFDTEKEIINFSDYFFSFADIRFCVDENIKWTTIINWYDYCMDGGKINLKTYNRRKKDYKNLTYLEFNEILKNEYTKTL